jgi:transposase-like protein
MHGEPLVSVEEDTEQFCIMQKNSQSIRIWHRNMITTPRLQKKPIVCPKCKSPYWDVKKKRGIK